jgi:AcrR family transcriptional regulator
MSQGWEDRQQRTRRDVLRAVGEIVASGGLDGLTMRKLADRAGVAVATLYNQFDDRKGVLVAFVGNGLDQLEIELDEQPAADPIDATRVLFAAVNSTIAGAVEIWQPVLATLKSDPASHRLGALGDRIVASIEHDLGKAAAAGVFVGDVAIDALAHHIFVQWVRGLERWAQGLIDWHLYLEHHQRALELAFAAVLVEPYRSDSLRRAGVVA